MSGHIMSWLIILHRQNQTAGVDHNPTDLLTFERALNAQVDRSCMHDL